MPLVLASCDQGESELNQGNEIVDDGRTPGQLLPANVLPDFTTPESNQSFPKNINPDTESGFNVSLFTPVGGRPYDQYQFSVNLDEGTHIISYDFMAAGLNESNQGLTIFFDTPSVRTMSVSSGSSNDFTTFGGSSRLLYTYNDNTFYNVRHEINLDNDEWVIFLNDSEVFRSQFNASRIEDIRISLGVIGNVYDPNIRVDIQNFKISNVQ